MENIRNCGVRVLDHRIRESNLRGEREGESRDLGMKLAFFCCCYFLLAYFCGNTRTIFQQQKKSKRRENRNTKKGKNLIHEKENRKYKVSHGPFCWLAPLPSAVLCKIAPCTGQPTKRRGK